MMPYEYITCNMALSDIFNTLDFLPLVQDKGFDNLQWFC